MKESEDDCYYNGRNDFCKATYPGQYEYCSGVYYRCVECIENNHCPSEKPHCDWDMECEECLVSTHCPTGESCVMRNGHWVCRVRDCVDLKGEGEPNYCANNFSDRPICDEEKRRCVECIIPEDCKGARQTCIDSVCVDESEMDCVQQIEAGFTNYCKVTFPERPVCHTRLKDCVECQFDNQCESGNCSVTRCIPIEHECEGPEDCLSDRYKCVNHECVKKDCSDYDDPDEFCDSERGAGWRCLDKICVRCIDDEDCHNEFKRCFHNKCVDKKTSECTEPDSEGFCEFTYGPGWLCKDGECVKEVVLPMPVDCRDYVSSIDANNYCKGINPERPICDFNTGDCEECTLEQDCPPFWRCWNKECIECLNDHDCDYGERCTEDRVCVKKTCDEYEKPDQYCRDQYGSGYMCENKECKLTDCDGIDGRCPEGFYCPEHECIFGCSDGGNCPDAKPHCSVEGSCVECIGPVQCEAGYDCVDYRCVKKEDCQHNDSWCPKNEWCNGDHCEEGCVDSRNCSNETPHCSQRTGKCEVCWDDRHCERGYDCEDYRCVWVGYDCSIDPECPSNWFCLNHFCVFGCNISDDNCGKETPHCSQQTGECEECWSDVHCEWWQTCDDENKCIARKDYAECKEGDKKHGKRCRDGVWVNIECKGPDDCLGHEYCDDGVCRDRERGCEVPTDCPFGYYCDLSSKLPEFHKCVKQICRSHEECPAGQGCDYAELGPRTRGNMETHCISWGEFMCSDEDPCPEGWVCDAGSHKCVEALCGPGRACQDDRYVCEDGICVPRRCETRDDPRAYCISQLGPYGICRDGYCVIMDCSFYPDSDMMCQETNGENWRCENKRCIDLGAGGGEDPRKYCSEMLGVDAAYWDFEAQKCEVPDCNTVNDPDKLCAQLKDPRYKCRGEDCRRGREGEECARTNECVTGLRCGGGLCMEKECITWEDCEDDTKWCNHGVCEPLRTECEGPEDCRDDYHCDAGGNCIPNMCDNHYDCGEGECCNGAGECVECETLTCTWNFECRAGWRCNTDTNRCQRVGCTNNSVCEEGYYCDLDIGQCVRIEEAGECWDSDECLEGMECKGAEYRSVYVTGYPWGHWEKRGTKGICVNKEEGVIVIEGIRDFKTCNYCLGMIGRVFKKGEESKLPPYHEHCRCWSREED